MEVREVTRRAGGRSARVRAAVHQAVTDLLVDHSASDVTVPDVAARSGVHPTSIYRRWGTVEALVLDVAVARLEEEAPIPETGALRSDLVAYAHQAARGVTRPDGLAFLRAVITTADTVHAPDTGGGPVAGKDPRLPFLAARGAQIQVMLDRADGRGEPSLVYTDVLDAILAPIYLRVLFGVGGIDDSYLARLVDHLLARTHSPAAPVPRTASVPAAAPLTAVDTGHGGAPALGRGS